MALTVPANSKYYMGKKIPEKAADAGLTEFNIKSLSDLEIWVQLLWITKLKRGGRLRMSIFILTSLSLPIVDLGAFQHRFAKAGKTFWARGIHGVSMRDLTS